MTTQQIVATISFVGIAIMIVVYLAVLARSRATDDYAVVQPRAYRIRTYFFWILLLTGFLATAITLRHMPYARAATVEDPIIVEVTGHQWYWEMGQTQIPSQQPVVFRVTSADVNHGFGIYDPDRRLIAQVQVMPGYVNELAVRFEKPGTYWVMCLEYCGLVHHAMVTSLQVVATSSSPEEM